MNIVILDDYQDTVRKLDCASMLEGHTVKVYTNTVKGVAQLSVRLRDAEVLVLIRGRTAINAALLDKLPRLRLVVQTGPIGPHLDVAACTERGVAVSAGISNPRAVAEYTFALLLAAMRRLPQYVGNLKHGAWQQSGFKSAAMPSNFGMGELLYGKTLGLWGYDTVAQLVAGYARAFGMQVRVYGEGAAQAQTDGYDCYTDKAALFSQSDVLSLHLPETVENVGAVSLGDLGSMKPTALLVNTAFADLLQADALLVALNKGRPGLAAVDVFDNEPILQGQALLRIENCICSPHVAEVERANYESMFTVAFGQALGFIAGQSEGIINPDYLQNLKRDAASTPSRRPPGSSILSNRLRG